MSDTIEWRSTTYRVFVGCGNIYITIDYNKDNSIHRIRIQRTSKFKCPIIMRDSLARQATFQARRDIGQLVKDLKGNPYNACDSYNITITSKMKNNELAGYSCADAISKIIEREVENGQCSKK